MSRLTPSLRRTAFAAGLVAAGMLIVGGVFAQGAQAATVSVTIECDGTTQTITAAQGDSVVVTAGAACLAAGGSPRPVFNATPGGAYNWSDYFSSPIYANSVPTNTYEIQPNAPTGLMPFADSSLPYVCNNCGSYAFMRFNITAGGGSGEPSVASEVPAPIVQALPLPASGTCTAIDDAAYAYGTGLTGGWTKSWQEWITNARGERVGGWGCGRTLSYGSNGWQIDGAA